MTTNPPTPDHCRQCWQPHPVTIELIAELMRITSTRITALDAGQTAYLHDCLNRTAADDPDAWEHIGEIDRFQIHLHRAHRRHQTRFE